MLSELELPVSCNYVGAFLTLRCNLNCPYCLNKQGKFEVAQEMSCSDWARGLARIPTRLDLPITLQGGEPTIYPEFYRLVNILSFQHKKQLDLLTNGMFDYRDFSREISVNTFQRGAKYASIRFSFHSKTDPYALALKVWTMQNHGYEVGIWGLKGEGETQKMKEICTQLNIDYREKELLGSGLGTYKYPKAVTGRRRDKPVWCRGSELLIGPSGHIYRCHADLYGNRDWIGHILDEDLKIDFKFRECNKFGECNPCDVKLKTNRLQEGGHCSVEIKGEEVI